MNVTPQSTPLLLCCAWGRSVLEVDASSLRKMFVPRQWLTRSRQDLIEMGLISAEIPPKRPIPDHVRKTSGQLRPTSPQIWPTPPRVRPKSTQLGRFRLNSGPTHPLDWGETAKIGRKLGQRGPKPSRKLPIPTKDHWPSAMISSPVASNGNFRVVAADRTDRRDDGCCERAFLWSAAALAMSPSCTSTTHQLCAPRIGCRPVGTMQATRTCGLLL